MMDRMMKIWATLTEEVKYEVWSTYVENGGLIGNYVHFCNFMEGKAV